MGVHVNLESTQLVFPGLSNKQEGEEEVDRGSPGSVYTGSGKYRNIGRIIVR